MKEILNSLGGYFMLIIFILSLSAGVKLGFAADFGGRRQTAENEALCVGFCRVYV